MSAGTHNPDNDPSPWIPMSKPIDLKHLGKLAEELGELQAAVSRCIIQGIDATEPTTGKPNRQWLEEEIADVTANIGLNMQHFSLDMQAIHKRSDRKFDYLKRWHAMLEE